METTTVKLYISLSFYLLYLASSFLFFFKIPGEMLYVKKKAHKDTVYVSESQHEKGQFYRMQD